MEVVLLPTMLSKGYLNGVEFGSGDGSKLWNHGGDVSIARNRDTNFICGDYNCKIF